MTETIKIIKLVAINDRGYRIGQSHRMAVLSDQEVEQVRDLHEFAGWRYAQIAEVYGQSYHTIARICRYEKRNQTIAGWRKVEVVQCVDDAPVEA